MRGEGRWMEVGGGGREEEEGGGGAGEKERREEDRPEVEADGARRL